MLTINEIQKCGQKKVSQVELPELIEHTGWESIKDNYRAWYEARHGHLFHLQKSAIREITHSSIIGEPYILAEWVDHEVAPPELIPELEVYQVTVLFNDHYGAVSGNQSSYGKAICIGRKAELEAIVEAIAEFAGNKESWMEFGFLGPLLYFERVTPPGCDFQTDVPVFDAAYWTIKDQKARLRGYRKPQDTQDTPA